MSAYCANITGSDSYWYKRRSELEATFEQMKPATAFFTFSYPDNHWDDLHALMPGPNPKNDADKRKNVINNPHLVDWFFGHKLNEFLHTVFDNILECEWRWHRFEWQSRSTIHAHGAARFKNDPNLIELTTKVYAGRLALKKINEEA
ncbi:ATP-dependent DNA helicase pif1, partial [Brachionus plicatilis]